MPFACNRHTLASAVLLLLSFAPHQIDSSTVTSARTATPTANLTATCEFRTINYITDSLPQLCFKSSWSANVTSARTSASGNKTFVGEERAADTIASATPLSPSEAYIVSQTRSTNAVPSSVPESRNSQPTPSTTETMAADTLEDSELNEASFLSFEEWKKLALEKAGQQNAQIGGRKSNPIENRKKDLDGMPNSLGPFGEEGEIDLDFGAFQDQENGQEASQTMEVKSSQTPTEQPHGIQKTEKRKEHRSKDAGKTCKERFSYASFDAGATVLKTHQGAKNSKSILIENKDSYMLSVCSKDNKFVIIELSEDIWIDTVVLANYEFFSSMIRTFRVSVSDRYPVKLEKWKNIGTYEARNSRDIQAFLIENPQIWARYIRIEFLTHFGNEYYCPLSLVRVHGTRMLESWKESEAIGEDDDVDEGEEDAQENQFVHEAVADVVQDEERQNLEMRRAVEEVVKRAHENAIEKARVAEKIFLENGTSSWSKFSFPIANETRSSTIPEVCFLADAPVNQQPSEHNTQSTSTTATSIQQSAPESSTGEPSSYKPSTGNPAATTNSTIRSTTSTASISQNTTSDSSSSNVVSSSSSQQATTQPSKTQPASSSKNKTTSTSSSSPSLPTIQESFFKAVSRRLQLLETNSTLSLKYIEEQSRILREAFSKVEKKQLQKSSSFLDTLNNTVLTELRGFRQQYDEIWQSTIISLESQREESRREIFAISARLNILADEVVFQKRMSIVQSILLLLCLGLVIFSRVSSSGQIDFPELRNRFRNLSSESPLQSPVFSPEFRRMDSMRSERSWAEPTHRREASGDFGLARSRSRDGTQTPISLYSRSDYNFTPPSGPEEIPAALAEDFTDTRPDHLEPPRPRSHRRISSSTLGQGNPMASVQSSPARSLRKRAGSLRQIASPPPASSDLSTTTSRDTIPHILELSFPNHSQIGIAPNSPNLNSPTRKEGDEEAEQSGEELIEEKHLPPFNIARKPLPALPKSDK
ncbi:UNC-like C-terminal-domain-containing protein [Amylocarpus encephaloides]|uniref:UNC-like C-terminal-domain-containing protein n=1 Tax=Amylocarpus encephaloides TaxID=45428 RepID=A0A9P7YDT2_9HELO|nr:UNC-like C-terminal-domain-containing protein [Amylocarpus encephaloides]